MGLSKSGDMNATLLKTRAMNIGDERYGWYGHAPMPTAMIDIAEYYSDSDDMQVDLPV